MCTKYFADGDVHKYFNPYETPYEAFVTYMNIVSDLRHRLDIHKKVNGESKVKKAAKKTPAKSSVKSTKASTIKTTDKAKSIAKKKTVK